jgi:hypothetical protein
MNLLVRGNPDAISKMPINDEGRRYLFYQVTTRGKILLHDANVYRSFAPQTNIVAGLVGYGQAIEDCRD